MPCSGRDFRGINLQLPGGSPAWTTEHSGLQEGCQSRTQALGTATVGFLAIAEPPQPLFQRSFGILGDGGAGPAAVPVAGGGGSVAGAAAAVGGKKHALPGGRHGSMWRRVAPAGHVLRASGTAVRTREHLSRWPRRDGRPFPPSASLPEAPVHSCPPVACSRASAVAGVAWHIEQL